MTTLSPFSFTAPKARRLAQRGVSLVELMVGLVIGLALTLGLFTLISNQSSAFKTQDDFARMQENGASALRYVGDSVRMAGFYGYTMDPANINTTIGGVAMSTAHGEDCGPPATNWALNAAVPISGFPVSAGSPGLSPADASALLPCIRVVNFLDIPLPRGQQVLITRSAGGYRICNVLVAAAGSPDCTNPASLLAAQRNYTTTVYLQGDPNGGLLFYGSNFAALKAAGSTRTFVLPGGSVIDVDIFEYRAHVYYLRPCSRPADGGADCTGARDDAGQPIPTLVRQELIGSAMIQVPLVEGIERIDFRYGVDTTGDGIADRFTAAPADAAAWANVVAVKVSVLVRSPTLSSQYNDSAKSYDLDGDGTVDYSCIADVVTPQACSYKRKVFAQTFQLRNIAQRRGA